MNRLLTTTGYRRPTRACRYSAVAAALVAIGCWALAAMAASAPAKPSPPMPAPANPKIMSILQMLYHRGETLKNFQAHVRVTVNHLRSGETDINIGRIWYEHPRKGHTEFDIHFSILAVDGAIARHHADHDIIFDGRWLIDRNGSAKIYRKIEIAPPGRHFNPLKLGEGPIPIPVGQRPLTVLREFHVKMPAKKKLSPNCVAIKLTPRNPKAFTFDSLTFLINTRLKLPVSIKRVDPDGTPTTAVFSKIVINKPMHHSFHISPPPADAGWTVTIKRIKNAS
ncbi:MAG: LolA family protein [Phycisphaerae bacterium]